MVKKALVICLLCCFLTSTLSVQSMAASTQSVLRHGEPPLTSQMAALKQKFYDAHILGQEIVAYKLGRIELTQKEIHQIRATLLRDLKTCLDELGSAEAVTLALNTISTALKSNLSSAEKAKAGIGTATLIGAPIGWPIYALSWIIYGIAKAFEDPLPGLGLVLFTVSVILEYIGLYFIL